MFITSHMRIAHTAKVMFSEFLSFFSQGRGVLGVRESALYEHILATIVLIPVGGGCPGKCTISTFLLQKCSCPRVCVWGGVFRKMHYSGNVPGNEHILGLPARGMQLIFELPSCSIPVDHFLCDTSYTIATFYAKQCNLIPFSHK